MVTPARASIARRGRRIARFLQDPLAIAQSAATHPPAYGQAVMGLPAAALPETSLAVALAARSSARRTAMTGAITLEQVSALLSLAARSNRVVPAPAAPDVNFHFRPYPSAGALYPCDIHIMAADVAGLAPGAWRYDALNHQLIADNASDDKPTSFDTCEIAAHGASPSCAIVIAGTLDRATVKYGARGYRFAVLEAGHISQNIVLAATALSLPSLVYGSFCDTELERLLGLDGINEVVLSVILVGSGVA